MAALKNLSPEAVEKALEMLQGWEWLKAEHALHREFRFADFSQAFAFMTAVALECQALNHHPDWSNSYNTVSVRLSTHSSGGITDNDIALADAMDKLFERAG